VVATHSNYLSILFNTGILGAIPLACGYIVLIYRRMTRPDLPRDLYAFSILFYSFSEADVPAISIVPTLMFFVLLALDAKRRVPALKGPGYMEPALMGPSGAS